MPPSGRSPSAPAAPAKPAPKTDVKQEFHALDKVRHSSWGEGVVLESRIDGGDEVVTIQFKSVGLKKVIAGMTKLVKLSKPLGD